MHISLSWLQKRHDLPWATVTSTVRIFSSICYATEGGGIMNWMIRDLLNLSCISNQNFFVILFSFCFFCFLCFFFQNFFWKYLSGIFTYSFRIINERTSPPDRYAAQLIEEEIMTTAEKDSLIKGHMDSLMDDFRATNKSSPMYV